ncbi:MAG: DUF4386 domain-containing protein [Actinomycetia bacterium]|nr:DUF4386 domain-containing protein [Actinomycetes bacterium]
MDDKKWEKWAVLGGVGFVILNVVGVILQGTPPKKDDSNAKVLEWFTDQASGIRTSALLGALSLFVLLLWFGSLWRRMAKAEGNNHRLSVVSLVGFLGSGAMFAASTAILTTVAIRVDGVGEDQARFFYTMSMVVLSLAGPFIAAHLAATNLLALRTGFLPKWNAMLGLLPALAFLVGSVGAMSDDDAVMYFGLIGFVTWMIWILATSVHLWKTADTY